MSLRLLVMVAGISKLMVKAIRSGRWSTRVKCVDKMVDGSSRVLKLQEVGHICVWLVYIYFMCGRESLRERERESRLHQFITLSATCFDSKIPSKKK